jgi:hypothetical protein
MRNAIGERQAELALLSGKMFSVEEALKVGLVDEMARDKDDAIQRAQNFISDQSCLPGLYFIFIIYIQLFLLFIKSCVEQSIVITIKSRPLSNQ